jgi:hypothetical protein
MALKRDIITDYLKQKKLITIQYISIPLFQNPIIGEYRIQFTCDYAGDIIE